MLRFSGKKLQEDEMQLLKDVSKFTLNKFIPKCIQKNLRIKVVLKDKMPRWSGECYYVGNKNGIRYFEISVSLSKRNKLAKESLTRIKDPMKTLIHELIHVKQYATNQMFDYVDGNTRFEGKIYKNKQDYEAYWNSPWEIEAYGRTEGLYDMFVVDMKKRAEKA